MAERRGQRRRHLYDYFDVISRDGQLIFGKLVDVSREGMGIKLVDCREKVSEGTVLDLEVEIPKAMKIRNIQFSAQCVWCGEENGGIQSGFKIVHISEEDGQNMKKIFE